jgi:glycosyltransferase involved in cell wall biosynthesis
VASSSGEIPHVVGDAGLVVAEGDAPRWRDAISGLLLDENLRRMLGERGRRRAIAEYDWATVANRHAAFFDELLAGGQTVAEPA